jgi:predicted DNA-binding protein (UPF0251 family)
MAIVRFRKDEILPLSEKRMAELRELAKRPDDEIDYSDIPKLTEENAARMVRVSDYPSVKEAMAEAMHLHDMQRAGMTIEELEAYRASRAGSRAAQTVGV